MDKQRIKLLSKQSIKWLQITGLISFVISPCVIAESLIMKPVEAVTFQELPPPWEGNAVAAAPVYRSAIAAPRLAIPSVVTAPQSRVSSPTQNYIQALTSRAQRGDVRAQYELGKRYQYGSDVRKSRTRAHRWLYKASEAGLPEAKYALSLFYQNYVKTPKGIRKALLLLKKSADSGYAEAQYALGMMFQNGTFVNTNPQEAQKWLQLAARQGHTTAQTALR